MVFGDPTNCIFPVRTTSTETVAALKEVIKRKREHQFHDVDADDLVLWRISLPLNDELQENIKSLNLALIQSLLPRATLLELSSELPIKEQHLHIVASKPPSKLCCHSFLHTDYSLRTFKGTRRLYQSVDRYSIGCCSPVCVRIATREPSTSIPLRSSS